MVIPVPQDQREAWLDLSQRYEFLYDCTLQEGLVPMREDIAAWWWLGGKLQMPGKKPAGPTLRVVAPDAGPSHASVVAADRPRRSCPPAAQPTVTEPEPHREGGFASLPPAVRDIIRAVSEEHGVPIEKIMGWQRLTKYAEARQECYRRLRKMPWRNSAPSLIQIGLWLHRDHTTIMHGLQKADPR